MSAQQTSSDLAKLRKERDRYVAFAFASSHLLIETDLEGKVLFASGASCGLVSGASKALVGMPFFSMVADKDGLFAKELFRRLTQNGRLESRTVNFKNHAGRTITLMLGGCLLPSQSDRLYMTLTIPDSNHSLNGTQETNEYGLTIEKNFENAANARLQAANKLGLDEELTLIVLDGLQDLLNGPQSTSAKDAIGQVSAYLRSIASAADVTGQVADDRIGVIHSSHIPEQEIRDRVHEIMKASELKEGLEPATFSLSLDIGDMQEKDALKALSYAIKTQAKAPVEKINLPTLQSGAQELLNTSLDRISQMREIIDKKDFDMVYQPIVDMGSDSVHHYEALLRVNGLKSPQEFITFAEDAGMIEDFDLALMQTVLETMADHAKTGWYPTMAVNVSAKSIMSPIFFGGLQKVIGNFEQAKKQLMIELTETVMIDDFKSLNLVLQELRKGGVAVCMDDVGSGTTSFQSMYDLEVDFVKIDGQFVRRALQNPKDFKMLKSMVKLSQDLGTEIIGEQVETEEQAQLLSDLGVNFGQGFLYGKPASDITSFGKLGRVRRSSGKMQRNPRGLQQDKTNPNTLQTQGINQKEAEQSGSVKKMNWL